MEEKKKYYIVYQISNKINDMIYIGVHITENVNDKYFGSGTNIKKAIKEFGKEHFDKIILHNLNTKEEMLEKERVLVNEEFIKRGDTYNIILGGGKISTDNMIVVKDDDNNTFIVHKTDPRYLSGELKFHCKNTIIASDVNGNIMRVSKTDPRYLSGELENEFSKYIIVKDGDNNIFRVLKTNEKYINGELMPINKYMVSVKDKYHNTMMVSINDPRYLSGELVPIWKGKKHKIESRKKMSNSMKGKGTGQENSQYGTCWIHHLEMKISKKIKKEEINKWLLSGWIKGRKMNF